MTENFEPSDLEGAEIVGYDYSCDKIRSLQIRLKDGTLLVIQANGSVSDKRFKVSGWLEIWTWEIRYDRREKLL